MNRKTMYDKLDVILYSTIINYTEKAVYSNLVNFEMLNGQT